MQKILFVIFCLISAACVAQTQKTDKRFSGLDTTFARVLKEWKAAGFAVAVVEKDQVVYAKGFGYEDYENKKPVSTNTQFAIGSCTKAFTAALLGILRKDELVDFDKPVRNYLPELKFYTDDLNNKVTLRDMMTHRTGLPRHDYSWYLWQSNSTDSLLKRIQYLEPSAGLRETWQYNNWMYFAQGAVAAKLTGKSWNENIREKFFVPLEMTNTNLSLKERMSYPEVSKGYYLKNDSIISNMDFYDIDGMGAAGSINSTVLDMAKWVSMWIYGGKYKGKEIVPVAYTTEAKSAQMVSGAGLPGKDNPDLFFSNYGLGWAMTSYSGHYRVDHGGNIDGFSASTTFFPADSMGIIVLTNQNGSSVPGVVRNILADRMLGLKMRDWQTTLKAASDKTKKESKEGEKGRVSNQKKGTHSSHPLKDYEGIYNNPGYGNIDISLRNDSLFGKAGHFDTWLRHYHYDVFEALIIDKKEGIDTSGSGMNFNFRTNEAGNIESLSSQLEPSVKSIEFIKKSKIKDISKDSLKVYLGKYDLNGLELKVFFKGDSTLTLFAPGQPEYELQLVEKDLFGIKILKGFTIKFLRDENNEINGLLSQQPNGTFKATKK